MNLPSKNQSPNGGPPPEFGILQNSVAFRHLQKQISKMKKHFLAEGYTQKQVQEMLYESLLRSKNKEIDWHNLSNTCDYYTVLEKYNGNKQIAESALKFNQEINQMKGKQNHVKNQQIQQLSESIEVKPKKGQIDVNEISDRFLYRLDHNCKVEQASSSSSSSESGESESYSYKLSHNSIQLEQEIEQKQQLITQQTPSTEPSASNIHSKQRLISVNNGNSNNNNSNNNMCLQEDQQFKQRKNKKRKAKYLQDEHSILEEDNFRAGEKQSKKICKQGEPAISHSYVGKKRKFLFNHFTSSSVIPPNVEGMQGLAELEEIKLLERKIRYFTENEIIDENE